MYRYSTKPINVFVMFNPAEVREMWLTFKQEASDVEITRTKEDLAQALANVEQHEGGWFSFQVSFTQEESSSFSADEAVLVQIRWSESEGHSDMTDVYSFPVDDVLKEGVI